MIQRAKHAPLEPAPLPAEPSKADRLSLVVKWNPWTS